MLGLERIRNVAEKYEPQSNVLVMARFEVLAELVCCQKEPGLESDVRAIAILPGTLLCARYAVLSLSSLRHRPPWIGTGPS